MNNLCFFVILGLFVSITKAHWGWGTVQIGHGINGVQHHVTSYQTHGYNSHYNHQGHRGQVGHGGHGMPDHTHFEFYYPKGVKMWKLVHGGINMFGIQFSVNPDLTKRDVYCDICVNTTTADNGRLLIEDNDLMVRPGDKVAYISHFGMGNHVYSFPLKTWVVTGKLWTNEI